MNRLIPRLMIATAVGHTLVGVALFHGPLTGIFEDGFFNAIGFHFDRGLAFWFLLFSPVLFLLGQIISRAVERRDAYILRIVGWYLLGIGVVGAAALPISGFWALILLASLSFRSARQVEAPPESLAGIPHLKAAS